MTGGRRDARGWWAWTCAVALVFTCYGLATWDDSVANQVLVAIGCFVTGFAFCRAWRR